MHGWSTKKTDDELEMALGETIKLSETEKRILNVTRRGEGAPPSTLDEHESPQEEQIEEPRSWALFALDEDLD